MTTSRLHAVPIDHVVAELSAFPLAGETTLPLRCAQLDPRLQDATAALWRQAENRMLSSYPGFSVDELVAMRDRIWFTDPHERAPDSRWGRTFDRETAPIPLRQYVRSLAHTHLEVHGDRALPRLLQDGGNGPNELRTPAAVARTAWQWLSLAMPPDLLLAALGTTSKGPHQIETLSPTLARHLKEHGFAETHLHVGAGLDFALLWNAVLHALADTGIKSEVFHSPGAALDEGKGLAPWLVRAAIVRYLLAAFLSVQQHFRHFEHFFFHEIKQQVTRRLSIITFADLTHTLWQVKHGKQHGPKLPFATLQALYTELSGVLTVTVPQDIAHAVFADPIIPLLPGVGYDRRTPEVRLIAAALQYLDEHPHDSDFALLFWQIVRIRSVFYRHVVQRPMTPGLQWFVRVYGRGSPARRPLNPGVLIESAARLGGVGQGLCSLEFRTSPETTVSAMRDYLVQVRAVALARGWDGYPPARQTPQELRVNTHHPMTGKAAQPLQEEGSYTRGPMELGLVYHFIKQREGGAKTGQPRANWHESHADPSSRDVKGVFNGYSYRYGAFYQERSKEAASLEQLLRQYPLSLQVIRGVDVCTDELGVPNWVMTPLIERVRHGASDGILALQKLCGVSLPQLRTTAHSGEDFVHLLTGLRNVDQTLGYFRLSEGDRIGHGLALGIHPKEWAQRAGRIPMMCEERLFDLVWEWSWYAEHGDGPGHGRHVVLEHEIARLSHLIFGTTQSPYDLKLLQADLGNHELLYKCGFPNRPPSTKAIESWCTATDDPEKCRLKLLHSYLVVTSFFPPGFPRG